MNIAKLYSLRNVSVNLLHQVGSDGKRGGREIPPGAFNMLSTTDQQNILNFLRDL